MSSNRPVFDESNFFALLAFLIQDSCRGADMKKKSKSIMTKIWSWFLKEQFSVINGSDYASAPDTIMFYQDWLILQMLHRTLDFSDASVRRQLIAKSCHLLKDPENCSFQIVQMIAL